MRLTGLAVALILIPTLLSIIAILLLFLHGVNKPAPAPDIEIRPPTSQTVLPPIVFPSSTPMPMPTIKERPPRPRPTEMSIPSPVNTNASLTPTAPGNANE